MSDTVQTPVIEKLPLDTRGHLITDKTEVDVIRSPLTGTRVLEWLHSCAYCDTPFGSYGMDITDTAVRAKQPCPYPDGITSVITLHVPSGKIIVTDDLRPAYDWYKENGSDKDGFASYNSVLGQHQVIKAMAAIGCAYGPVGNSCPSLYQTGSNSYIIANPGYDDNDEPLMPKNTRLANICTDLWAYSIADFEDWKKKGGDPDSISGIATVVDIPAGTYRFTHHTGERGFDHYAEGTVVFAHIERITD